MSVRMTEEEYADLMKQRALPCVPARPSGVSVADMDAEKPRRAKYGNRRVEIDGMKFDSQKEADFYFSRLLPAWRLGELKLLARQVPFDLPGGIKYVADFVIVGMNGDVDVIDTKSEATKKNRVYINKKKQMASEWGIEIKEV